jgi:hypothetical protein
MPFNDPQFPQQDRSRPPADLTEVARGFGRMLQRLALPLVFVSQSIEFLQFGAGEFVQ